MIRPTHEWRLLRAPSATYRELAAQSDDASWRAWLRALGRILTPAVVIGIAAAVAATGRVTWSLALSGTLCWSFVSLVQLATALAIIAPVKGKSSWRRAVELFFTGHAAWSLWAVAVAAVLFAVPGAAHYQDLILLTFLAPGAATAVLIHAFCRGVLQLTRRQALVRTALHQSLTYIVIFCYIAWGVQLWPRVLAVLPS